ncbi:MULTISPECIES: hypothetical protein [unclassified Leifsonia]|uniref:hypothetical protein n=1 Tax=unclassified Leifsonia TaxID=2663824 RepID=UPI0008A730F6|nr:MULTISPECIES: hypothetical protein [unclassified Leifsonia]SEI17893.1 hypothetical protein SAMN04515694_1363 [Leifsonia sp. CL154]SFM11740.1 hypothetical protein SAMN04515692_1351 [Leifsonia sp. CL147]
MAVQPSVAPTAVPRLPRLFRITSLVTGGVAGAAAILVGFAFAVWVHIDDHLTFPAMRDSMAVHYPAGHELFGWALATSLWLFTAIAITGVLLGVIATKLPWTRSRFWAMLFLTVIVAVTPVIAIRTSMPLPLLAFVPSLVSLVRLVRGA